MSDENVYSQRQREVLQGLMVQYQNLWTDSSANDETYLKFAIPPSELFGAIAREAQLLEYATRTTRLREMVFQRLTAMKRYSEASASERFSITKELHLARKERESFEGLTRYWMIPDYLVDFVRALRDNNQNLISTQSELLLGLDDEHVWLAMCEYPVSPSHLGLFAHRILPTGTLRNRQELTRHLREVNERLVRGSKEEFFLTVDRLSHISPLARIESGLFLAQMVVDAGSKLVSVGVTKNEMIDTIKKFCPLDVVDHVVEVLELHSSEKQEDEQRLT